MSRFCCCDAVVSRHTFQGMASSEKGMYLSSIFLPNLTGCIPWSVSLLAVSFSHAVLYVNIHYNISTLPFTNTV
jgi:hypothetical protein